MQVNFEGLLKGIWLRGATTRFCQQNGGGAVEGLKDQVVLSNLAFRFTAIRVTVWEIRLFEGKPAEIANSAGFTFLQKLQRWVKAAILWVLRSWIRTTTSRGDSG